MKYLIYFLKGLIKLIIFMLSSALMAIPMMVFGIISIGSNIDYLSNLMYWYERNILERLNK